MSNFPAVRLLFLTDDHPDDALEKLPGLPHPLLHIQPYPRRRWQDISVSSFNALLIALNPDDARQITAVQQIHTAYPTLPLIALLAAEPDPPTDLLNLGFAGYLFPASFNPHTLWQLAHYHQHATIANPHHLAHVLREISSALSGNLSLEEVLNLILEQLAHVITYDNASVMLLQEDLLRNVASRSIHPGNRKMSFKLAETAHIQQLFAMRRPLIIPNTDEDARWQKRSRTGGIVCWLGVPLIAHDEVIGLLNVSIQKVGFYTEQDAQIVFSFANQAAIAIENARLFEEISRRTAELEALTQISTHLRRLDGIDAMLDTILVHVTGIVDSVMTGIYLVEPETETLVIRATHPFLPPLMNRRQPLHSGITGHVARTGEMYLSDDINADPRLLKFSELHIYQQRAKAHLALPLRAQDQVIGVMHIDLNRPAAAVQGEINLLTAISEIAGSALYRAQVQETLEQRVVARTRELENANRRLQQLDRLKSKFIDDISHELRTPITSLSLYLDLMERGRPEKQAHYIQTLKVQTARLRRLVEGILQLTRLDVHRDAVTFTAVSLNQIVADVTHSYREAGPDLTLTFNTDPGLPAVWGSADQITQLLDHLLSNGVNYTDHGRITVTTRQDGRYALLHVEDTGCGISEEDIPHIFERFYRGDGAGQSNVPGLGLGLTVAREIVNQHEGTIKIDSRPGEGTAVTVRLPLAPDPTT